jgi:hypothetical protein
LYIYRKIEKENNLYFKRLINEKFDCLEQQLSEEENEILGGDRSGLESDESGEDLFGDEYER